MTVMTVPIASVVKPPMRLATQVTPDHIAICATSTPASRPDSVTLASNEIVTRTARHCSQGIRPAMASRPMAEP